MRRLLLAGVATLGTSAALVGAASAQNTPPVNAPGLAPAEIQRRLTLFETRIDFGSKILFEPELALGVRLNDRWSAELSWVHISNGEIFHHGKNQGLDDAGVRVIYALDARGR